jgi:hypothetical protein
MFDLLTHNILSLVDTIVADVRFEAGNQNIGFALWASAKGTTFFFFCHNSGIKNCCETAV